ncbi:MAG: SDR family oxidoreductase, partial [Gammaproteobacteria bacterium]|nr:SDR family oxidoreductase [Gammaproteobacteria bacterium]
MLVVITGAGRGIGRGLALHYLRLGHRVAGIVRRREAMRSVREEAGVHGDQFFGYLADVTDSTRMDRVMAKIVRNHGALDLVVANAGIGDQRLAPQLSPSRVREVMDVNFLGVVNTLGPAIDQMLEQGFGQLAVISSLASVQSLPR